MWSHSCSSVVDTEAQSLDLGLWDSLFGLSVALLARGLSESRVEEELSRSLLLVVPLTLPAPFLKMGAPSRLGTLSLKRKRYCVIS